MGCYHTLLNQLALLANCHMLTGIHSCRDYSKNAGVTFGLTKGAVHPNVRKILLLSLD